MAQNPRNPVTSKVVPLKTTNITPLVGNHESFMLWHLHANNVTPEQVTVEIHIGDTTKDSIDTLLLTLVLPPNSSENVPVSMSQVSFEAGAKLSAKASVANAANVVINTEVR